MGNRRIGLIGGLGPEATVHYYRSLLREHEARGAVLDLLMIQAEMPRVVASVRDGRTAELAEYFAGLIGSLRDGGAAFAVIPAVTPHICAAELERISLLPIVNILETTAAAVMRAAYNRVALFGTRYTIESDFFGGLKSATVVRPAPSEIDRIHDIYYRLASTGTGTQDDHRELTTLARQLMARDGVEAILLAGTDLAAIFDESNTSFSYVDCAATQIADIMRRVSQ